MGNSDSIIEQCLGPHMNAAFRLFCTSLLKKHYKFTELTCAMTLQVGCMHTRCNGTSSTEQAMSMEMGNGSSSAPPPPSPSDTALSSARSFKRLQHAGGGISEVDALPIARDFRPFLLATESTCSSFLALLTSGRASQTITAIFPSTGDITLHDAFNPQIASLRVCMSVHNVQKYESGSC
jgi:hypothetical protein